MHRVIDEEDFDDTLEDLVGAIDYLSDKREEEEVEELDIFSRLVAVAVIQHALVIRRRLVFDPLVPEVPKWMVNKAKEISNKRVTVSVLGVAVEFFGIALAEFSHEIGIRSSDNGMVVENRTLKSKVQTEEYWRNGIGEKDPRENEFTKQQWNLIKEGKGLIAGDVRLTSKLVSKVFKISYLSVPAKGRIVTDSQMKGEFGNLIGAKSYYMVRNAGGIRAANLFWYLEKLTGKRDRHRTFAVGRVAPYLAAIFEHVLKVTPATSGMKTPAADTLMEEGTKSGSKHQKLLLGSPTIDVKSPFKVSWKDFEDLDSKQWVDGLKTAMDEQFKELDEKVVAVTTENVLLINRLSPLAKMKKIENERLVAEMQEMRKNRKEIKDSLSKLKAEFSSGLLESNRNLAAEMESNVEKQADPDFVVEKVGEPETEGDIGEQLHDQGIMGPGQPVALATGLC
ncbi:hypothetical protein L7F22_063154 [Adiantum nelumboides]|nr:hypothetical protein [Adiantum nelumboides]